MKTAIFIFIFAFSVQYAFSEDGTRELWHDAFAKPQPKVPPTAAPKKTSPPKPKFNISTPQVPTANVQKDTVVGVTIWRLIPAGSSGARLLVQEPANNQQTEWTAERVAADAPIKSGDRVRISLEAARDGYLYVIDREKYADGTAGDPYLIFPTTRTLGGDNRTSKGRVIEFPSQTDKPSYFTLKPGKPDQIGELLTVIVTPTPLQNLMLGPDAIKLNRQLVEEWESKWGKKSLGRIDQQQGEGQLYTEQEKSAGSGQKQLFHDEPLPQSIYYSPDATLEDPLLIQVLLKIKQ